MDLLSTILTFACFFLAAALLCMLAFVLRRILAEPLRLQPVKSPEKEEQDVNSAC
jgi:hypothetical protein